ncbi:MAG: hypothetical protein ABIP97_12280 [Chthoniobacterales bacterium]
MTHDSKITVVLTACIQPLANMAVHIQRVDPEERLKDYRAALTFWLQLPDSRITHLIFIDNSDYPLAELEAHAAQQNAFGRKCEFISLPAMPLPPDLHYGYLEFRILDEGFSKSKIYGETPYFMKVTGRYRFPAITRLLNSLPDSFKVAVDSRDNDRFTRWPRHFTAAALLIFETAYYNEHLRLIHHQMRPAPPMRKQFIEDILFDFLIPNREKKDFVLRWSVNCDPEGIGASGDSYASRRKQLISLTRAIGRKIIPWWWF